MIYIVCLLLLAATLPVSAQNNRLIFHNQRYSIYADRVIQGKNKAIAISSDHIESNYQSPLKAHTSPVVEFKFSINGKDNEMPFGINHHFLCNQLINLTPPTKK